MTRRGMTLLELAVAGTLLGTLLVVCLQLLQATAAQRRAADQRQLALLEVGNVLERLAARPWADLTPESASPRARKPFGLARQSAARRGVEDRGDRALGRAERQADRRFPSLAGPQRPIPPAGQDHDVEMEEGLRGLETETGDKERSIAGRRLRFRTDSLTTDH